MDNRSLVQIREAEVNNAGGDVREGLRVTTLKLTERIRKNNIPLEAFSLRNLYENVVAPIHPNVDVREGSVEDISEALQTSGFPTITRSLIHNTVMAEYSNNLAGADRLVTEDNTNQSKYEIVAGFTAGEMPERVRETMPFPEGHIHEKEARIEIMKTGKIMEISREMVRSDQTGKLVNRARAAGEKMGLVRHRLIVQTLTDTARTDLGESSSTALYFNDSARTVFANDHSSWDYKAGANDNLGSTAFGHDGLAAARLLGKKLKDENGDPIMWVPRMLAIPDDLGVAAMQLRTSIGETGTANNDVNFFGPNGAERFDIFSSPYIDGSATEYYYGDFPKDLMWLWLFRPQTIAQGRNSDASFERDIVQRFRSDWSGGCGRIDYRHTIQGST